MEAPFIITGSVLNIPFTRKTKVKMKKDMIKLIKNSMEIYLCLSFSIKFIVK